MPMQPTLGRYSSACNFRSEKIAVSPYHFLCDGQQQAGAGPGAHRRADGEGAGREDQEAAGREGVAVDLDRALQQVGGALLMLGAEVEERSGGERGVGVEELG